MQIVARVFSILIRSGSVLVLLMMLSGYSFAQDAAGAAKDGQVANPPAATKSAAADEKNGEAVKRGPMTKEEERQAQLVADTNRLLQLSQELKAEVAKSNKDTLSLAVIKKATEVEKLAKSLKERMRNQQ